MTKRRKNDRKFEAVYAPGNWIMFPKVFLYAVPIMAAFLLSLLIDESRKFHSSEKTFVPKPLKLSDGWFWCSMERMANELNCSVKTQSRWFSILKEKGFIEMKIAGLPARRYVRINWAMIEKMVEEQMK